MKCAQCSITIVSCGNGAWSQTQHFRCCDADVCSLNCALKRRQQIKTFDPDLKSPVFWEYFTTKINDDRLKHSYSKQFLTHSSIKVEDEEQDYYMLNVLPTIAEEKEKEKYIFTYDYEFFKILFFYNLCCSFNFILYSFVNKCSFIFTKTVTTCNKLFK